MTALKELRLSSTIAVDSAAFLDYDRFAPTHATTNPSILLSAAKDPTYRSLVEQAKEPLELAVLFGKEILERIPGHLSIQLDPHLSFDTQGTIAEAHQLAHLCLKNDIPLNRILVKIAGTWEGILATKTLEKEGIACNVTVILGITQAIAAAEAGATCIAPYVGRVTDWYKNHAPSEADQGVHSLASIYQSLKARDFTTQIMAASFRTPAQIIAVCGCDILTIQPKLLDELIALKTAAPCKLTTSSHLAPQIPLDEKNFRWLLCNDPCASYLLDDALRRFAKDQHTLISLLKKSALF